MLLLYVHEMTLGQLLHSTRYSAWVRALLFSNHGAVWRDVLLVTPALDKKFGGDISGEGRLILSQGPYPQSGEFLTS